MPILCSQCKSKVIAASLRAELVSAFKQLHTDPPAWAWPFAPSIPFIGNNYKAGKGLLIYASAENFTWMDKHAIPKRFTTHKAWDRYRAVYEDAGKDSDSFFPDVGIAPVSNGGLLAAGLFVSQQFNLRTAKTPRAFLDLIAVSNVGKFCVKRSIRNMDYISNVRKLTDSLPFVVAELAALQPRVVLVPKKVWKNPILSAAMRGAAPGAAFVPIPQFNATVVNTHLKKFDAPARMLHCENMGTKLEEWMNYLKAMKKQNAWRYLAGLKDALDEGRK